MKQYIKLYTIIMMILFFIVGSYDVQAVDYKEQLQNSMYQVVDASYTLCVSVYNYCVKICSELHDQIRNFFVGNNDDVKIQNINEDQESSNSDDEDVYLDYDKCSAGYGQQACLLNEKFFGDTYYGIGDENADEILKMDA